MKKVATLCYPINGDKVLLGRKKKNIGTGKWNGFGGVVEFFETVEAAARRELKEESRLTADHLQSRGLITFHNGKADEWQVHVFLAPRFRGVPEETAEMATPQWFSTDKMPYDEMLPADRHFLPLLFRGFRLQGVVHYNDTIDTLLDYHMEVFI